MDLNDIRKVYFIGIGGIGMSALARYFARIGAEVSGYDLVQSDLTKKLEVEGLKIHYVEDVSLIPKDVDLVVYTPAIPSDHRELVWYRHSGIPLMKRAEVLGVLSKEKYAVCVAGTHGKTTTCALITQILKYCGIDVTAFVGGILKNFDSNFVSGQSDILILEADEFDRSFLHLEPDILIILSLDADHLDVYGDEGTLKKAYEALTMKVSIGGHLIMPAGLWENFSESWMEHIVSRNIQIHEVGHDKAVFYDNVAIESGSYVFDYYGMDRVWQGMRLDLPGAHNVFNASAALCTAELLVPREADLSMAVGSFRGIKRRFDKVYDNGFTLIDDYAHHPEELKFTLDTVLALFPGKRTVVIFQPHLYSRTRDFHLGFAEQLSRMEEVWLLPVYPAREKPIDGVNSDMIFSRMTCRRQLMVTPEQLIDHIRERQDIEVIVTIGASDLDKYHNEIINVKTKF